jgi:hypothetical protein
MDVVTLVVGLPFAPLRGLIAVAEVLRDEAERELYDPARLRRQLEDVQAAAEAGEISPEEAAELEEQIVGRMTVTYVPAEPSTEQDGG